MDTDELNVILENHKKWLNDEDGGTRADLRGAELSGAILIHANLRGADLRRADLRRADLSDADLRDADLRDADLRRAVLSDADLSGAVLSVADLRDAVLRGAVLRDADLSDVNLIHADLRHAVLSGAKYKNVIIKYTRVFSGLYKYQVISIIADDNTQHIALGCKFQIREEWSKNFWNNTKEFPDNGSEDTEMRKFALRVACEWLDLKAARGGG